MTREEEIENKASELAQKYFPNEHNIWARENIEAQYVYDACIEMTNWADEHPKRYSQEELCGIQLEMMRQRDRRLIEKVCKWLEQTDFDMEYWNGEEGFCKEMFINDFRKAMEE